MGKHTEGLNHFASSEIALSGNHQEVEFRRNFGIDVSKEDLETLQNATTNEERRSVLERLFPEPRRGKMLEGASEDSKGRKVKYYRYMKWPMFYKLLENKKLTAIDHFPDLDEQVDHREFCYFVLDYYVHFLKTAGEDLEKEFNLFDELKVLPLDQVLAKVFPLADEQERRQLATNLNYRHILPFVKKYFDPAYVRRRHSGSATQKFSSNLSLSVGGIISDHLSKKSVYVEMVIPDRRITPHHDALQGEKEVFTEEIELYNVVRTYDSEQIWTDIILNPDTEIGKLRSEIEEEGFRRSPVEKWRWDFPTNDYLPVSLAKK